MAAVSPAGPEPMITTCRLSSCLVKLDSFSFPVFGSANRRKYVGVFGCAYSITRGVQVSRTRLAPAILWPEPASTIPDSATLREIRLRTISDENNNSARPIQAIAVLGARTMGHGIAQVAAAAGYAGIIRDLDSDAGTRGVKSIQRNLAKAIQLGKISDADRDATLQRIDGTTGLAEIRDVDLVIEAAPENLELKQNLLREAEALVDRDCIFATNTSSLSIGEIASASTRPAKVVGMHFFNPVHIMRLVEIVRGEQTGPATTATVREVAVRMKKEPIIVRDVPGFASSRLGVTLGLEAMRMLEQGVASARDIDTAMELGYNHAMR